LNNKHNFLAVEVQQNKLALCFAKKKKKNNNNQRQHREKVQPQTNKSNEQHSKKQTKGGKTVAVQHYK